MTSNPLCLVSDHKNAPVNKAKQENAEFVAGILAKHFHVSQYLTAFHARQARSFGAVVANKALRRVSDSLVFDGYKSAAMDDESICNIAKVRAELCERIYHQSAGVGDTDAVRRRLEEFCEAGGVVFPLKIGKKDTPAAISKKIVSAALRVSDAKWWRRQLRTVTGRCVESTLREIGGVCAGRSAYVSNYTLERWKKASHRNAETLKAMEAVTEIDGESVSVPLDECVASSVSNPVNRRNELMVRMRGYEEVATGLGLTGVFLTLTCPSKYHAITHGRGLNPKYEGATPRECMEYLNDVWARIRAEWARSGVRCFGFRVAEPHHDGTPHFHFMLFMPADSIGRALDVFGRYAMEEDGDEPGADKYRWDSKIIDPEKGTASGYIAKYVAKNIDGFAVDYDDEGDCHGADGAIRARAWASVWGIRQFQQIGSVSVTVYRELRRNCELFELPDSDVDDLRAAADRGDWARFVELMGGPLVERKGQTLRPLYQEADQFDNAYCEPVKKMIGLWLQVVGRAMGRSALITRDRVWKIRRREPEDQEAAKPPNLDL
ncbi:Bacteriophage replication gene A protein (GPA) [Thalassolituus maritimus]|uniref:Bacteriophage replication gene A protein (GPA) n=1 Tax=Thalassolituus maritimus TaxID=484498 RepID=A0A1N7NIB9_9GAMM|nr:replication endonuclease [Thalassolituus maritimus]SIS98084.1 Bacteriophage replication gene A protein (GPA) [Thalassolituus maritimus]